MPPSKTEILLKTAKRWLVTFFCLIFLFSESPAERLPVKTFTSADGLGSSFVNYMMRDSHGFLWFCTRDGLSRFDGSHFVTYQVGDNAAPPGIENILETRQGIYWITTTGGLYRFDPKSPVTQTPNTDRPTLNAQLVSEARGLLYEDRAGNIWFGNDDLHRLEEKDGQVSFPTFALNLPVHSSLALALAEIFEAQDSSLWIITSLGLVRRLPDGREILYRNETPRAEALISVIEDRKGRIWVGRASGVYIIKPESLSELAQLPALTIRQLDSSAQLQLQTEKQVHLPEKSGEIFKYADLGGIAFGKYLYQTADEHVWISTGDGVVEFDGQKFLSHSTKKGLLKGGGQLIEDLSGNLWLGWSTGLARLDRKGFTTFNSEDGLKSSIILAINESRDDKLFVTTLDFFLSQFDETGFQTIRPQLPPNLRALWMSKVALLDSRNEWWFLTSEHLYHFAGQTNFKALAGQPPLAIYDNQNGLKGDEMFHGFEDSHGDLWFSTRSTKSANFGLAKWNRATQKFQIFSTADGFPPTTSISSFAEDKAGNLWLGAYEAGGLFRYSNGRFSKIENPDSPAGVITSLLADKLGRLWVASSLDGLSRIDNPKAEQLSFVHFTIQNGLASNNVRSLVEDNFGNIYAGTARGIDRLSPETNRIRHYSVSDGLAGDFVNLAIRDHQGVLWFGTPNGLSRLVPEQDKESSAPPILLGGLRIAGESRPLPELGSTEISNIQLDYTQNNLQIDYFGIDFDAGQSLLYQYMLEDADKDWNPPTEQRTVAYANLASGDYRFMVRAVNASGAISRQPAIVSFKIWPPFWRRWWFIAGIIFLLGLAVFSLDRYRIAKTHQVETALSKSIESETRFRTLAETASDAIMTIDAESTIVFVNEAVEKTFGYAAIDLIGKKMNVLMPEYLLPPPGADLNRYLPTNQKNISWSGTEFLGKHKSGARIPLELSFGEFELEGQRYITGVARDITERKQSEEALRKSRQERFAELERVRSRIARDLHDDIGSSLTQIALFSEVARASKKEKSAESLNFLVNISNELVDAMSDIVWAINPQKDHLHDLTQRMRRFASESLTAARIDLEFHAPQIDTELGANLRREVFLIFKESVNNIAKHSEATKAKIEFGLEKSVLSLSLEDNGRGFEPEESGGAFDWENAKGGNGLLSMRKRAEELGGKFHIESKIGAGTIVRLTLPLDENLSEENDNLTQTGGGINLPSA